MTASERSGGGSAVPAGASAPWATTSSKLSSRAKKTVSELPSMRGSESARSNLAKTETIFSLPAVAQIPSALRLSTGGT
jgi:hypothetical protein